MYQKTARRLALCGALLLAACASPFHRAEELALRAEWLKAVIEYRKAVAENPRNVEARSRLKQAEMQAAEHFYARGLQQIAAGNLDGAITQFQQGLVAMPENGKLLQAMNEAVARKEADLEFEEGKRLQASDKKSDALAKFKRALELYPAHAPATAALAELKTEQDKSADGFVLKSREPIALNFRQTDMKQAFDFLAKAFGINIIFDEGVRGAPVTLYAKRVTFEQGLNLILNTTKTFYKRIGPNTLLIAADSKEKRGQYEDHLVRTFQLNTISAKEMADILKGVVTFKKLIVNERLNSIVVRDTAELITLAEKIIDSNDRKPAELLLEVEILEVNRTTAEKLGLDLGAYEISARTPSFPATARVRDAIRAATITIPSVALRFFKQDVDAKTLANPKVRVLSGKSAKIHIGDRVPLRSATIQDATGQVRTTYDYRDIGIRLGAEPIVHLDNSTTVKLMLEVSALGENLGTPNDPAFRIGTRNAETLMLLRDGETAILGGLIRDEERNTRARIPGLGSIPAVGSAFTSYDDSGGRTDVLLTITPRVVRGWDVQTKTTREFYSGSETVYTVKPLFPEIDGGADVQMQSDAAPATGAPAAQTGNASPQAAVPAAPAKAILPADAPFLAFGETAYEVAVGQEINIKLVGGGLGGVVNMAADVLYSPQVLSFVRSERGDAELTSLQAQADGQRGAVQLAMQSAKPMAASGPSTLARLVFTASKPGISYVVYRVTGLKTASGEPVEPQLRASRVVVK